MARLVFLGRLADVAGTGERTVNPGMLADVLAALPHDLAEALRDERIRIAHNGTLLARGSPVVVDDGDELAFLPPVSGG